MRVPDLILVLSVGVGGVDLHRVHDGDPVGVKENAACRHRQGAPVHLGAVKASGGGVPATEHVRTFLKV